MLNFINTGIRSYWRRKGENFSSGAPTATERPDERAPATEPMYDVPLYNSRIIDCYIRLLEYKYDWISVEDILRYARMTRYEVADQGHWFTQRQINRFHKKLSALTQNENISREAGRYSASPDAIGVNTRWECWDLKIVSSI
jgi:hypothetical protein